jgi:hypothetical protein
MELVQQIRTAQLELGWSTQHLLNMSGLSLDRSTLQRKLTGDTPTTSAELEALADAIRDARPDFRLEWPSETTKATG